MSTHNVKINSKNDGMALLVTLLTVTVLIAISISMLNITLKQYQLSGITFTSEIAFQAASAGMECAQYLDFLHSVYDVGATRTLVQCFGVNSTPTFPNGDDNTNTLVDSGEGQHAEYEWGNPQVCTHVSVYKFYDTSSSIPMDLPSGENMDIDRNSDGNPDPCPQGSVCTVIQSRGYNVPCTSLNTDARVVEREYTQVY